jgi:chaperonin cofactor prefoldin
MNLSKRSVDVTTLDPKINNRLQEVRKVLQQIDVIKEQVQAQVGDLLKKQNELEKQLGVFNNELMGTLKELKDHAIQAEGIYVELKHGRRSPKVGFDYLAERVNSQLLTAANEAITKAAEFASAPTFKSTTVPASLSKRFDKQASLKDWITKKWNSLTQWLSSLKAKVKSAGKSVNELDALTR